MEQKINSGDLLEGLKNSRISPGVFAVSSNSKSRSHTVVFANNEPVLSLGFGDIEDTERTKTLLNSEAFRKLVSVKLDTEDPLIEARLSKGESLPWKVRMACLAPSKVEQDGLWWIVFGEAAHSFATALSINTEIERIAFIGTDENSIK